MKLLLPLLVVLFGSAKAWAKNIDVVAGLSKPPYIYQENGEVTGFEIELIQQIFSQIGLQPKFHLTPYGRSMRMLTKPNLDAIITASPLVFKDKTVLTKPYINYQNVVVSLAHKEIVITDIKQLANYSIAAFQIASKVLGEKFAVAAKQSPYYTEVPEQRRQLIMLEQEKVNTLVMDINIFNHFKWAEYPNVNFASVFPLSFYGVAFKDPELVTLFNRQWLRYKKSEQYQRLKNKYKIQQQL